MEPAVSPWTPSIANALYTLVLTIGAIVAIYFKGKSDKSKGSGAITLDTPPVPTAGLAKRWHDEWQVSQVEVKRLEYELKREHDGRHKLQRLLETSEMERARVEQKSVMVEQLQSSIMGKLDVIGKQIELFKSTHSDGPRS